MLTDNNWTIFGATNTAFFDLGERFAEIYNNTEELANLILYHAVDGPIYTADLVCGESTRMANGQNTSTECHDDAIYQIGEGNSADAMPQILASSIHACNGLLNIVDEVILPAAFVPVPQEAEELDCKTIGTPVCYIVCLIRPPSATLSDKRLLSY